LDLCGGILQFLPMCCYQQFLFSHQLKLKNMHIAFDSYIENGRLIIITTDYVGDEKEITENFISLERAKEILKDLQLNINLLENQNNE
jgi:hypothetical protein